MEIDNPQSGEIDEALYSRQLYVLGHDAMRKMSLSNILICGLNGLGVEIAKNVILAGVKSVTIQDSKPVQWTDLSAQFYLTEADIGKNRAAVSAPKLAELNKYVPVRHVTTPVNEELVTQHQVVVLVNALHSDILEMNKLCRANGIKLITTSMNGLFGRVFVDLGDEFTVNDVNGEEPAMVMVSSVSSDNPGLVTCSDDNRHNLETGDYVTFTEVQGMTELNDSAPRPIKVKGPYTFEIEDTSSYSAYTRGGYARQVKQPKTISFKSYADQLEEPAIFYSDFAKMDRPLQLHVAYQALEGFSQANNGQLPRPGNLEDAAKFFEIAQGIAGSRKEKVELDEKLIKWFSFNAVGALSPTAAFLGGIVGQEVLKACSGKFMPIQQFMYFDALECLPKEPLPEAEYTLTNSRYDGQIAVFGKTYQERLTKLKFFLVGAGAIGCEMLKNWALMGIGCSPDGHVYITDMDTIETSNLNRQFLFRSWDVRKLKSQAAASAGKVMNPALNITAHENRVGVDTENVYDDDFMNNLDGVCNALDNVEARLYMDSRCVTYRKPLLDSGTLGTKGNVQVVVPHVTESYASSRDPPEKSIPICTLKNFPNRIEHTLQWARDHFEGKFKQAAEDVNNYLTNPNFVDTLDANLASRLSTLDTVKACLVTEKPLSLEDCVKWARLEFENLFNNSIRQLLYNFPRDMKTSTGSDFWSGPKRAPDAINFDVNNEMHLDFIVSAANLRAEMYGLTGNRDPAFFKAAVENVIVPEFTPKDGVKIQANENEAVNDDTDEAAVANLLGALPAPSSLAGYRMAPIDFEKDDDTNLHMTFIVAASNLRATNYSIETADRHRSKLIAGKIIPAIATTTALVTGLVCFEQYKLFMAEQPPIESFKNSFVNLALPFLGFSEPIACPKVEMNRGRHFTLWDRIDVNKGDLTLQEFIDYFNNEEKLSITMISCGVSILYSMFMPKKERFTMKMSEIVELVTKKPIDADQNYLSFEICCVDPEDDDIDVECPYVKYKFR